MARRSSHVAAAPAAATKAAATPHECGVTPVPCALHPRHALRCIAALLHDILMMMWVWLGGGAARRWVCRGIGAGTSQYLHEDSDRVLPLSLGLATRSWVNIRHDTWCSQISSACRRVNTTGDCLCVLRRKTVPINRFRSTTANKTTPKKSGGCGTRVSSESRGPH